MMAELIDRRQLKAATRELFQTAQVPPKGMAALYLGLGTLLNMADSFANNGAEGAPKILSLFVTVLTSLLGAVLGAGFVLYCMDIRRGARAEYLTLFDGFSFAGKIIALTIVQMLFIFLWAMLFVIPGIIAAYRYRFALYNLCEDPGIGVMEALNMSKRQTLGYKSQLFILDWSYFGWGLLAIFPTAIIISYLFYTTFQVIYTENYFPWAVLHSGQLMLWTLLAAVWAFAVALFYRPNYQCVELGYFEIAKRTSGVGLNTEPTRPEDDPNSGWTGGWGQM